MGGGATGRDFTRMQITMTAENSKETANTEGWVYRTRHQLMREYNQNSAYVDDVIARKRNSG
eukprot:4723846-Alexandrium_andersonii.AAC.1